MKHILGTILLVLMLGLFGCRGADSSSTGGALQQSDVPDQTKSASVENIAGPDAPGEIKTFSVEPVEGWIFLDSASKDTFKSYNLLEPYVGSANFWVKYVSSSTFGGEEKDLRAAVESQGFSDYEFVSADKLSYEMPTVRCIMNTTINGMNFTLGHYFMDAPGDKDIYFQLSTSPENFPKAQPVWEEALETVTVE